MGPNANYTSGTWKFNDIQPWNYSKLPEVFGGGTGDKVSTEGEFDETLQRAWNDRTGPSLIQVTISRDDHSQPLVRLAKRLSERALMSSIPNCHNCHGQYTRIDKNQVCAYSIWGKFDRRTKALRRLTFDASAPILICRGLPNKMSASSHRQTFRPPWKATGRVSFRLAC